MKIWMGLLICVVMSSLAYGREDGVISGGGFPKTLPLPEEDFKFSCVIEFSEQIGSDYTSATAQVEFPKSAFQTGFISPSVDLTTGDSLNWKQGYSSNKTSPRLPQYRNGHLISLFIGENKNGQRTSNLWLRVGHKEAELNLSASSRAGELFSAPEVSASSSLYVGKKNRDLSLAMTVTCRR